MPLALGKNDKTVAHNIKKLLSEGYDRKQAIAIAMNQSGRSKKPKKKKGY